MWQWIANKLIPLLMPKFLAEIEKNTLILKEDKRYLLFVPKEAFGGMDEKDIRKHFESIKDRKLVIVITDQFKLFEY